VRLVAAEARAWLVRIGFGLVALWLALLFIQVFVLLLALSPLLVEKTSWSTLGTGAGSGACRHHDFYRRARVAPEGRER
jgi:hypothetical protein